MNKVEKQGKIDFKEKVDSKEKGPLHFPNIFTRDEDNDKMTNTNKVVT